MRYGSTLWCLAVAVVAVYGEAWRWPDAAESVRIDTKVRFVDDESPNRKYEASTFTEAHQDNLYKRAQQVNSGEQDKLEPYRRENRPKAYSEDSVPKLMCKCVYSTSDCNNSGDLVNVCGSGKHLCCYPHKSSNKNEQLNSEIFNELEDERLTLLPGKINNRNGAFPPPPNQLENADLLVGPQGHTGNIGPPKKRPILVGPVGSTGIIGLPGKTEAILVGPKGPTGTIGPNGSDRGVLVGPGGPTGLIGPGGNDRGPNNPVGDLESQELIGPDDFMKDVSQSGSAQRGVLVGPGGPTGIIGPGYNQRPVLVGPGGPTGVIGPGRTGNGRGVLVGPGGPTGIIGPYGYNRNQYQQGVLVGPGGPTGTIGPGRQLLVGPGGPTGFIGPNRNDYLGK